MVATQRPRVLSSDLPRVDKKTLEALTSEALSAWQRAVRECEPFKADRSDLMAANKCHSAEYAYWKARNRWIDAYQQLHGCSKPSAEAEFARRVSPHQTVMPQR